MGEECDFDERSVFTYAVGIFLVVGVIVSYVPQHATIVFKRTSFGISWVTTLLANVSSCCNVLNVGLTASTGRHGKLVVDHLNRRKE